MDSNMFLNIKKSNPALRLEEEKKNNKLLDETSPQLFAEFIIVE